MFRHKCINKAIAFDLLMDMYSITSYTFYGEFEVILFQKDIRMFAAYNNILST